MGDCWKVRKVAGYTSKYRYLDPDLKVRSIVLALGSYSTSSINLEAGENFSSFANRADPVATAPMWGNIAYNSARFQGLNIFNSGLIFLLYHIIMHYTVNVPTEKEASMQVSMIKATNVKTGAVIECSKKHWLKELKKKPWLSNNYTVEVFLKEIKSFKFIAWIHPKRGGDDYQTEIDQAGENLEQAKKHLEEWLAKVSNVTNDYQVVA